MSVDRSAGQQLPHRLTYQPQLHLRSLRVGWFILVIATAGCDGFVAPSIYPPHLVSTTTSPSSRGTGNLASNLPCRAHLGSFERCQRYPHRGRLNDRLEKYGRLRQPSALSAAPQGVFRPILAVTTSAASSVYMMLLALQFGLQPILTQKYAGRETSILKTTYVGVQDVTRFTICGLGLLLPMLSSTGSFRGLVAAVAAALASYHPSWEVLVPAVLYSLQNYCSITGYQSLDAITYNVLNQTKTLFAALWCFALLQQRQSIPQMVALVMLVAAAFIMETSQQAPPGKPQQHNKQQGSVPATSGSPPGSIAANDEAESGTVATRETSHSRHRQVGVLAVLAASMTSGLAGAWTQRCLQVRSNNALVFSMELSVISLSLLVGTALVKCWLPSRAAKATMDRADDCTLPAKPKSLRNRLFRGWTVKTWIPVLSNSFGGILVGLVTKHAGVVPKGFALILGLFLSGVLQNYIQRTFVSNRQWAGGTLAGLSLYLHAAFPPPSL
jgi:solute carrier family 35 (UDP-sugar transporter), member A1/2/3